VGRAAADTGQVFGRNWVRTSQENDDQGLGIMLDDVLQGKYSDERAKSFSLKVILRLVGRKVGMLLVYWQAVRLSFCGWINHGLLVLGTLRLPTCIPGEIYNADLTDT
jgi:hypothetical protein